MNSTCRTLLLVIIVLMLVYHVWNLEPSKKPEFLTSADCKNATVEDCIKNANDIDNSIDFAKFSSVCKNTCIDLLKKEKEELYGKSPKNNPRYARMCPTRVITNKNLCLRNPRSTKINASTEARSLMYRDKYCPETCADWFDEQIDVLEAKEEKYTTRAVKIVHFKPKTPPGMDRYYANLMNETQLNDFLKIGQQYLHKLTGKVLNINKNNGKYEIITIKSDKDPGLFYGEFTDIKGALSDSLKTSIHNYFINELGGNYKQPNVKIGNYDPNAIYVFFIEGVNNHMYTNSTCGYAELIGGNSVENVNDKFQNIYRHPLDRNPQGALFVHIFLKGLNEKCSIGNNYKNDSISYLHHVFLHEAFHAMGIVRPLFQCTNIDDSGKLVYDEKCAEKMKSAKSPEHIGTSTGGTSQRYHLMYSDATGHGSWLAAMRPSQVTLSDKYEALLSMDDSEYANIATDDAVVSVNGKYEPIPEYSKFDCTTEPNGNASNHPRCYFRNADVDEK